MSKITPRPHKLSAARWRGLRVGLLGGSFNPAHAGHMHIAKQAIIRFKLHAVWWLVSPGNPLKPGPTPLPRRLEQCADFIKHQPRMAATDIEATLGTRFTHDTLKELTRLFPATRFIWIAGMDNADSFARWDKWAELPHLVPFVFFDRPPATSKTKGKKLRQNKRVRQHSKTLTHRVRRGDNGVYWMFKGPAVNQSSSKLRIK